MSQVKNRSNVRNAKHGSESSKPFLKECSLLTKARTTKLFVSRPIRVEGWMVGQDLFDGTSQAILLNSVGILLISEKLVVVRTCFLRLDRPGFRAAQLGHGGQVLDSDLRVYGNFLTCLRRGMILVPAVCGHHGVGTGSKDSCVHRCLSRNDRGRCHKLAIH